MSYKTQAKIEYGFGLTLNIDHSEYDITYQSISGSSLTSNQSYDTFEEAFAYLRRASGKEGIMIIFKKFGEVHEKVFIVKSSIHSISCYEQPLEDSENN